VASTSTSTSMNT